MFDYIALGRIQNTFNKLNNLYIYDSYVDVDIWQLREYNLDTVVKVLHQP